MQAVTALLWERWRRTRWAVIAVTLAPFAGWIVGAAGYVTVGGLLALSFWFFGTLLLTGVLLFGQSELQSLNLGFPGRLFRLPVGTTTLLAVYMGYGVAAIALPFLSIFGYALVFAGLPVNGLTAFLVLVTIFVWVQTLAWLKGYKAVFIFLVPSLTGVFALLYLAASHLLRLEANMVCGVIMMLCCVISFWNISADRRGAWISGWKWMEILSRPFRRRRTKDFASQLYAQTWFETRQTGYLFPVAALGFVGSMMVGKITSAILYSQFPPPPLASHKSIMDTLGLTAISAILGGVLSLAVYHRDRRSGAARFRLRQPVPTRTLALARLKTSARSLGITLGILMAFMLALILWDRIADAPTDIARFIPQPLEDASFLETGLLGVLALVGFALVCWAALELAREVFLTAIGVELVFVMVWVYFGGNVARTIEFWKSGFVRWTGGIIAIGLIIITLLIFYVAIRRKLIDTKTLTRTACAYPVSVVSLGALVFWLGKIDGWPGLMESIYILGLACVPFIPLASVPLSIAKQRHN